MNHFKAVDEIEGLNEKDVIVNGACMNCISSGTACDGTLVCKLYSNRMVNPSDDCLGNYTGAPHIEEMPTGTTRIVERLKRNPDKFLLMSEDECNKRDIRYLATAPHQDAKSDFGKPQLTLVPRQIIFDIAKVREYGNQKYGDPDNWKTVSKERYRDAAFRHFIAYLDDPEGLDEESGLPHLSHLACNIAFLCEMEKGGFQNDNITN